MDDAGKGIGNGNAGHGGRHMEFFLCGQALGLGQVHIDRVGEIIQHIQGSLGSDGLGKNIGIGRGGGFDGVAHGVQAGNDLNGGGQMVGKFRVNDRILGDQGIGQEQVFHLGFRMDEYRRRRGFGTGAAGGGHVDGNRLFPQGGQGKGFEAIGKGQVGIFIKQMEPLGHIHHAAPADGQDEIRLEFL